MEDRKKYGQVFTPTHIVRMMLDEVGYCDDILSKHIMDNSAGNGAFLMEAVRRYISRGKDLNWSDEAIRQGLETYIHGIEIQEDVFADLIINLNTVALSFGLENVKWSMVCGDSLTISEFDGKMDFVVGNPPYVRIHNLMDRLGNVRHFQFSQSGMTDLYLIFYEIGLMMLRVTGRMCLITPSSWLSSKAGKDLRKYILKNKNLQKIIDFKHEQLFLGITTFVLIALFHKNKQFNELNYQGNIIPYSRLNMNDFWVLGDQEELTLWEKISCSCRPLNSPHLLVKNGYATLADKIFIQDKFDFDGELIRPVYKASQGKWKQILFPYNDNGGLYDITVLKEKFPKSYAYLQSKRSQLEKRSLSKKDKWWGFGRSQAIRDTFRNKIAINNIIKTVDNIKLELVSSGSGLYSGLYILTDYPLSVIETVVKSEEFITYLGLLRRYKSGGYYTYSSKDLERYLDYKLGEYND